jgi:hypothetical protein
MSSNLATGVFAPNPVAIGAAVCPTTTLTTFSWAPPAGSKSGCTTLTVTAANTCGPGVSSDPCDVTLCWTNRAPVISDDCDDTIPVGKGNVANADVDGADLDACDVLTFGLCGVTPTPIGPYGIDPVTGAITFDTDEADAGTSGQVYCFCVYVTDGQLADTCNVYVNVLFTEPFKVAIEKTHMTFQGTHELVDVSLLAGSEEMGGFDILIGYDASALQFVTAIPGPLYGAYPPKCEWEYFTYRYSAFGNCGNQCPSGKVRVVGIAETNNGPYHPNCWLLPTPFVLFTLDFLVTDDRTFECQYVPIRFCWFDCGDNTISSKTGDSLFISRFVYDFDNTTPINDPTDPFGYPTFLGAQDADCFAGDEDKRPHRFIDFCNGGVDIACADPIDARGDINLNEIANEIADAVLFSRYFVYGLSVFTVNMQGQIAASDVNADGLKLSVADLVYLVRIIIGDANPYPKLAPVDANYTFRRGVMSVDKEMGAAFVVVEGAVEPTLLANNMEMLYNFDSDKNETRIIVWSPEGNSFTGDLLRTDGDVISVEMATRDGAPVVAKEIPSDYALNQNYPNPFNPKTTISFSLPVKSDYTLSIHNVTGQKVAEFAGTHEAGVVTVDWEAAGFASGIYFYRLAANNFSETKRMVLLK